ncbi:uracil DNA glycosylase [Arthrobotrys conoides]|uniref:Uracil-DNA glycosylase n=1 Tax=Arthrobotrys conoides TaxID=74498 RepID=A0AAN8RR50_9PEZI
MKKDRKIRASLLNILFYQFFLPEKVPRTVFSKLHPLKHLHPAVPALSTRLPYRDQIRYQIRTMSAKRKATDSASSATGKKPKAATITGFFSAAPSSSKTPFDKAAWATKLSPQQRELLKLEIDTLDASWLAVLKDALLDPSFLKLKTFLKEEFKANRVYPPANDVYSWSRHTPFDQVKVVILGQDPYHGPKQAHGLSFSVKPPTIAPPSLRNIFGCLENDYPSFRPPENKLGNLTPWAERGVLMLNTCLTVQPSKPNSHANKGWEQFTQKVIELVAQKRAKGVVFMAWGKPAQGRIGKINKGTHLILSSCHPSPLAQPTAVVKFKDVKHFIQANEWLEKRYGEDGPIDWNSINPKNTPLFKSKTQASTSTKPATPAGEIPDEVAEKFESKINSEKEVPSLDDDEEALREAEALEESNAKKGANKEAPKAKGKGKAQKEEPIENEYGEDDIDWDEAALKSDQVEEEAIQARNTRSRGKK